MEEIGGPTGARDSGVLDLSIEGGGAVEKVVFEVRIVDLGSGGGLC